MARTVRIGLTQRFCSRTPASPTPALSPYPLPASIVQATVGGEELLGMAHRTKDSQQTLFHFLNLLRFLLGLLGVTGKEKGLLGVGVGQGYRSGETALHRHRGGLADAAGKKGGERKKTWGNKVAVRPLRPLRCCKEGHGGPPCGGSGGPLHTARRKVNTNEEKGGGGALTKRHHNKYS